jgi:hypothetical protein
MVKTLNWREKQPVAYAIPLWLRDEQIKLAIARGLPRIEPQYEPRPEPAAVVGYGPSLRETVEQVREFKYIFSCSGSHKFLIERGIVPTWHVEVDPREHKVALLGAPHPDVVYLPASTCHPAYFDHLVTHGAQIRLWHVFDNEAEALRTLPAGEWALTGGCDVGLRATVIAAFFGFRDLHVFGLDGSARDTKHAADHPNAISGKFSECEYDGVTYKTTAGMLEAARSVWHELDQLPKITATFHGEGLVQHMARNYVRKTAAMPAQLVNTVGFSKPELISAAYRDLNAQLHRENLAYGVGGDRHAPTVLKLAETLKTKNVLDYGCGKGRLAKAIPWQIAEYDPAVPGKEESPKPADLVVCTDVLEHIEPDKILYVLADLRRCVKQIGFFTIHTGPSTKSLPDGRNAHILQRNRQWWEKMLRKFFTVGRIIEALPTLYVVVGPKR